MVPREERLRRALIGLAKGLVLIVVAGCVGVVIGIGLSKLSGDDEPVTPFASGTTTTASGADQSATTPAAATTPAPATTPQATTTTQPPPTQTTTPRPAGAEQVDVRVLGALLRPAGQPSGVTPQDGELVMRVRIDNRGSESVRIEGPILRIGKVRTELDLASIPPEAPFRSLPAGETRSVTLRFRITGEATPKATRDRRARIEIAGLSEPLRIRVAGT